VKRHRIRVLLQDDLAPVRCRRRDPAVFCARLVVVSVRRAIGGFDGGRDLGLEIDLHEDPRRPFCGRERIVRVGAPARRERAHVVHFVSRAEIHAGFAWLDLPLDGYRSAPEGDRGRIRPVFREDGRQPRLDLGGRERVGQESTRGAEDEGHSLAGHSQKPGGSQRCHDSFHRFVYLY
jgi:hypothetical protein